MTPAHFVYGLFAIFAAGSPLVACMQAQEDCPEQVTYLSDTEPAYRYLEQLQRNIYEAHPGLADPFSREELRRPGAVKRWSDVSDILSKQGCDSKGENCVGDSKLYAQMLKRMRCQSLSTRFESPLFMLAIGDLKNQVEPIRKRDHPRADLPRVASLPTGTIDAQAVMPPNIDRPIVILNRDLFFFTGAFSKALSDAIPIRQERGGVVLDYDEKAIAQRLKANPHIVQNFADAMARMVDAGSSRGAKEVTLDPDHNRLHARLVTAMDLFIYSHEEAHVVLQHVNKQTQTRTFQGGEPPPDRSGTPAPDTTLTIQMRTRDQELAADALGYQLMISALQGLEGERNPISLMVGAAAPQAVFRLIDSANTYSRAARGQSFGDANHPDSVERINGLKPVYQQLAAAGGPLEDDPDFRLAFDASLQVLLTEADPLIRKHLGLPAR